MSRHRIVRSMNYEDERYEDDEYDMGHSYEDRYCVSPSTAAQFTFNRDRGVDLSSYMGAEEIPEENADDISMEATTSPKQDAASKADQALLHSCLDELHNILGDSISEAVLTDAVVRHNYNLEAALNEVLSHQDAPKPQRPQRKRRDHAQGDDKSIEALLLEIDCLDNQKVLPPVTQSSNKLPFGIILPAHKPPEKSNTLSPLSGGFKDVNEEQKVVPTSSSKSFLLEKQPAVSVSAKSAAGEKSAFSRLFSDKNSLKLDFHFNLETPGPSLTEAFSKLDKGKQSGLQDAGAHVSGELKKEEQDKSLAKLVQMHSSKKAGMKDATVLSDSSNKGFKPSLSALISQRSEAENSSCQIQPEANFSNTCLKTGEKCHTTPCRLGVLEQKKILHLCDSAQMEGEDSLQSDVKSSSESRPSLTDLARRHTESKSFLLHTQSEAKEEKSLVSKSSESGLSLAALVKQHGISQAMVSQPDVENASCLQLRSKEFPEKAKDLDITVLGLRLRNSVGLVQILPDLNSQDMLFNEKQEHNVLSLESCLKKPQKSHERDSNLEDPINSLKINEPILFIPEFENQNYDFCNKESFDCALVKPPSLFAKCLGLQWRSDFDCGRKKTNIKLHRTVKFKRFQFKYQTRKQAPAPSVVLHHIKQFEFEEPSPDDLIQLRQQAAFTRSGQLMEEG